MLSLLLIIVSNLFLTDLPIMILKLTVELLIAAVCCATLACVRCTVSLASALSASSVKCVGYTDLPSRLPQTSSQLYANNLAKLILATGPQTTKQKGYWYIDHEDPITRGMLVLEDGKVGWKARDAAGGGVESAPWYRLFRWK